MSRRVQVTFALCAVGLIMVGAGLAAATFEEVEGVADLTRDTSSIAGVPWWTGAVSRLTNLCWAVAATSNLLAAAGSAVPSRRRGLQLLGLLCLALALDDTFLVHEALMPSLGISEAVVAGVIAVAGLLVGWWWLQSTADIWVRGAFFVGAVMLAVSLGADELGHGLLGLPDGSMLLLVEDGAKLAGVTAWCLCGVWASRMQPPPRGTG